MRLAKKRKAKGENGTCCPGKHAALKGGPSFHFEYRLQLPHGRIWIIFILTNTVDSCTRTIYIKQNALILVYVISFTKEKENKLGLNNKSQAG